MNRGEWEQRTLQKLMAVYIFSLLNSYFCTVKFDSHKFAPGQLLQQGHEYPAILNVCEQVVHLERRITLWNNRSQSV